MYQADLEIQECKMHHDIEAVQREQMYHEAQVSHHHSMYQPS